MVRRAQKFSKIRRLEAIREELTKADEVIVEQLARKFNVSSMTIHRDLEFLESQGDVVRTHGGATSAKRLTFEFTFRDKRNKNCNKKSLIARHAIEHIKNGQVIVLDTGTTTLAMAQELNGKRKIKLITTSLAIVSELQFSPDVDVVLLGGFLRRGSPDIHGPLTEQNIDQFRTDIAFMGADAIDNSGNTYTNDLRVVSLDQKMAQNAKEVIIVADSSKFGNSAMCRVFGPKEYDLIITDSQADGKIIKQLNERGIGVEIVPYQKEAEYGKS
jgi:DeoR/GlpR family transcriptional regulator of sugar metabolism